MPLFRVIILAVCALLLNFASQNAFAAGSGGFRNETPDAGAMGMGSAFVGEADTPAALYYNPAGINQINTPEVSLGDAIIAPRAQYTDNSGNTAHEVVNMYNVPNFYAVVPLVPNKLTIGIDGGSYWGLGENWNYNGLTRYAVTQATLTNLDNSIAVAYQVTHQWSLAVSLDNDYSRADESYKFYNFAPPDGGIELKANDDALGYRLATMFKINNQNQVGLMYRSRINHKYKGTIYVDNIGAVYNGLYPGLGSSFETNVEEKSVLPQSVILGYSFKPTPKWTINADVEWMDWSSTKNETFSYPNATTPQLGFLTAGGSTPEDWQSAWSEAFGTQYDVTNRCRVRLGYFHHGKVIPSANFDPLILDSSSNGYTAGFGFDITKQLTIDVAYTLAVYDTRSITNTVLSSELQTVNGKYAQYLNIGLVSFTYKF